MTARIPLRPGRRTALAAALAAAATSPWRPAHAQSSDWPTRPVSLVVPFPPGGPTDVSARLFARLMAETLGQPMPVDNRAGAGGTIGSAYVAQAAADGHTLLWGGTSTLAVAPGLYRGLRYEPHSFRPIGMAQRGPMMLAGRASLEAPTLKALLALAAQRPLTVATAGNGSIGHLVTEYLKEQARVPLTHVPYRGGAPAIQDAAGGQVDLVFDAASALLPMVRAGRLRAYGTAGSQPYGPLPEVPTIRSVIDAEFEAYSWFGLVAPAATPEPVVQKLAAAFAAAAQSADVKRELAAAGLEPGVATPRAFAEVIDTDFAKWSRIVRRANVTPE